MNNSPLNIFYKRTYNTTHYINLLTLNLQLLLRRTLLSANHDHINLLPLNLQLLPCLTTLHLALSLLTISCCC